ncbi:hypothetical protein L2E82_25271 [Cichorium intybus]|uniref:Uncharacterized protein n=1 Tax=Cichorium intybus TaxID=13427 RepID=A0ACB9E306_CICIN|nr:hypothetical protein L2E82_25271 [Cichorium intybus]
MCMFGSMANIGATPEGGRKDEWSKLQPIPAGFELQQRRFRVGLEDWESLLSESATSSTQDQSLRWISGDFDDTFLSLQHFCRATKLTKMPLPPPFLNLQHLLVFTHKTPSYSPSLTLINTRI